MKTKLVFLLIFSVFSGNVLFAQSKIAKFSFTFEYKNSEIVLKSLKGFTWKQLKFTGVENNLFYVYKYGGGNSLKEEAKNKSKVLFSIEKTAKGFRLNGIKGMAWKNLEFNCGEGDCRQKIDQKGMVGKKD